MTAPLTPPGCNVASFPYLPLDVLRLRDSDLAALATGDEFKAAILLWCKSWTETPAGSLPNEPRVLARVAGVALAEWEGIAAMALRGWVLCTDGRLYHPLIAERVLRAWIDRLKLKDRSAKGNATRYESFSYDAAEFGRRRAEAVAYLSRLCPDAASEFGVVLQGGEAPTGSDAPPEGTATGTPEGTAFGSQLNQTKPNETERNETERNGTDRSLVVPPLASPTREEEAFALFQDRADVLGLPRPKALDGDRRKKLTARLDEIGGLPEWIDTLDIIARSPVCLGQAGRSWKLSLDWLLQPANLRKVRDGNYLGDNRTPSPGGGGYMSLAMEGLPH